MSGKFLVFEGIDGCGKSTCVDFLKEYIESKGMSVMVHHEPNFLRPAIISMLTEHKDNYLIAEAAAMMFTADRLLNQEILMDWLKTYDYVLYDRYYLSTIAYQGAMGADIRFLHRLQEHVVRPDSTIFVDITPEEAKLRREVRGLPEEPLEKEEMQKKVYVEFRVLLNTKKRIHILKNNELEETKKDLISLFENFMT